MKIETFSILLKCVLKDCMKTLVRLTNSLTNLQCQSKFTLPIETAYAWKENNFISMPKVNTTGAKALDTPLVSGRLRNDRRNSILITRHYPDLGSAPDWLKQFFNQSEAHQYRIFAAIP